MNNFGYDQCFCVSISLPTISFLTSIVLLLEIMAHSHCPTPEILRQGPTKWVHNPKGVRLCWCLSVQFITARNEVGTRLYFHRHLWFCPRGGACVAGGGHAWHACPQADTTATAYGQWAGSTHPTGMHSCFIFFWSQCRTVWTYHIYTMSARQLPNYRFSFRYKIPYQKC